MSNSTNLPEITAPDWKFIGEAVIKQVWQNTNLIGVLVDENGNLVSWSKTLEVACSIPAEQLRHEHIDHLLKPEPFSALHIPTTFSTVPARLESVVLEPFFFIGRWRTITAHRIPIHALDDSQQKCQVILITPRLKLGQEKLLHAENSGLDQDGSCGFAFQMSEDLTIVESWGTPCTTPTRGAPQYLENFIPEADLEFVKCTARNIFHSAVPAECEFIIDNQSALPRLRRCRLYLSPLRSSNGTSRLLGQLVDITNHTESYRELRETEQMFRRLTDSIPEVFWVWNPLKQKMMYISPAYNKIWGRSRETLLENSAGYLSAIHSDDIGIVVSALNKQVNGENTTTVYRVCQPNGTVRWIRDRAFPLVDGAGRVILITGLAADITEDKTHAEDLKLANNSLSFAIKWGADGYWEHDVPNGTVYVNERWCRMLAIDPPIKSLTIEQVWDLMHPSEVQTTQIEYQQHLSGEKELYERELRLRKSDGSYVCTLTRGKLVDRLPDGRPRLVIGLIMDLTESKNASQRLRETQEQLHLAAMEGVRNSMLAAIAHEVNQPLFAIKNFAQAALINLKKVNPEIFESCQALQKVQKALLSVSEQSERGSRIVSELRSLARNKSIHEDDALNCLHLIIKDSIKNLVQKHKNEGRKFDLELNAINSVIFCEPLQMELVFNNLFENAIDATEGLSSERKTIHVKTYNVANSLIVEIRDHGKGLGVLDPDLVFEPYTSKKSKGLGLGLAICKNIVSTYAGSISCEPAQPLGVRFVLKFPLAGSSNGVLKQ